MAQYDLVLIQNTATPGIEYTERTIHLNKGDILTADASHVPAVLPAGTDDYVLTAHADVGNGTGLEWKALASGIPRIRIQVQQETPLP
jgi:hypothetical protein